MLFFIYKILLKAGLLHCFDERVAAPYEQYVSHDLFLEWLLELNQYENHC